MSINSSLKYCFLAIFFWSSFSFSQEKKENLKTSIQGVIMSDSITVPYVSVYSLKNKIGALSNEDGEYEFNIHSLNIRDTICFESVGFKTVKLTVKDLKQNSKVYLNEDIQELEQIFLFNKNKREVLKIVKNILKNKDQNYSKNPIQENVFFRKRDIQEIQYLDFDYRKSTIGFLNEKGLAQIEKDIPRQDVSYSDFYGDVYAKYNEKNQRKIKIVPERIVVKKRKKLEGQLFHKIVSLFHNTNDKEYWKVGTGILGTKIPKPKKDTLKPNERRTGKLKGEINARVGYKTFSNKDNWEFLHKTNLYAYELIGGTTLNKEDLYIIDFVAKNKGRYRGRMFVSMDTNALVKATYEYMPGKKTNSIRMFGFSNSKENFKGNILFEKQNEKYLLKYFSFNSIDKLGVERSFRLKKKRKRFLFDKTLEEVKLKANVKMKVTSSFEYLVLKRNENKLRDFNKLQQSKITKVITVNKFDEHLWENYPSIKPIKEMIE